MQRVGGQDPPGQVQAVQQRLEPGDLAGGVGDVGLGQDRASGVVHRGQHPGHRFPLEAAMDAYETFAWAGETNALKVLMTAQARRRPTVTVRVVVGRHDE